MEKMSKYIASAANIAAKGINGAYTISAISQDATIDNLATTTVVLSSVALITINDILKTFNEE